MLDRKSRRVLLALPLVLTTTVGAMAQSLDGDWKGRLILGTSQELPLVFHISTSDSSVSMDSPAQCAFGLQCDVRHLSYDSLSVAIPKLMVNYTAKHQDGHLVGIFKQSGLQLPLNLEKGEVEKPRHPQTPLAPFDYTTEEVVIASDVPGVSLSGTLTVPDNASPSTPVVVMVSGSGLQNRDEELFGHKPFAVIADWLARHGVASLRYDDRGCGKSTGDVAAATTVDFARDAQTVMDWLRRNRSFGQVGILGHSEGGMIAYMLCNANPQAPDFVVSVAGPVVQGEKILEYQNIRAMGKMGIPENQAKDIFRGKLGELRRNPWMAFFLDYNPADDLKAMTCPALLIFGENDQQVPAALNVDAARNLAPNAEVVVFAGLNHLMQHSATGDVSEYGQIEETFAPEALRKIAGFIKEKCVAE